jgi:CheY-like chemotaxis protein
VLQILSSLMRACLEGAASARKRAAESKDAIERRDLHLLEDGWNTLARSQELTERLERFLAIRQGAGRMLRPSKDAAAHRDSRDQGATIPDKPLISIVEDDTAVAESLKRFILALGYAGGTFVTAEEYLESEPLRRTACLICDVQLPGMSGPDLQDRLIADGHRIPIVFVTGHFSEMIRARVLKAGALGYFAKPFDPRALIGCLKKALANIPC